MRNESVTIISLCLTCTLPHIPRIPRQGVGLSCHASCEACRQLHGNAWDFVNTQIWRTQHPRYSVQSLCVARYDECVWSEHREQVWCGKKKTHLFYNTMYSTLNGDNKKKNYTRAPLCSLWKTDRMSSSVLIMKNPPFPRYTGIKNATKECIYTWLFSPLRHDSCDTSPDSRLRTKPLGKNHAASSRRLRRPAARTPCRGAPRSACRRTSVCLRQARPPDLWSGRRRRPRTDRGPEGILGIGERPSRSSPSGGPGWRTKPPGRWPAAAPSVDLEALFNKQTAVIHTQSCRCFIFLCVLNMSRAFTSNRAVKGI